jgi:DNA-binding transcriptional MerR regulator
VNPPKHVEPLDTLREYRKLSPWNVRDFSALACAFLDAAGVRPASSVAADHPTPRTIRYYVAQHILTSPVGKGPTATYTYQHLLELLAVKLRQVVGEPLKTIASNLPREPFKLEREIAAAIGESMPSATTLQVPEPESARGNAAKAFHTWHAFAKDRSPERDLDRGLALTKWHRVPIVRGLELHIHEGHPLAALTNQTEVLGDAVRRALTSVLRADQEQGNSENSDISVTSP